MSPQKWILARYESYRENEKRQLFAYALYCTRLKHYYNVYNNSLLPVFNLHTQVVIFSRHWNGSMNHLGLSFNVSKLSKAVYFELFEKTKIKTVPFSVHSVSFVWFYAKGLGFAMGLSLPLLLSKNDFCFCCKTSQLVILILLWQAIFSIFKFVFKYGNSI